MIPPHLEALLAADLTDEATRLILADALADVGRDSEAALCRAGAVQVSEAGQVERIYTGTPGFVEASVRRLTSWLTGGPRIWKADEDCYIVETKRGGKMNLMHGRLVEISTNLVSCEQLLLSIANWMPCTHFERYYGDPEPVMRVYREAEKKPDWNRFDPHEDWRRHQQSLR